MKEKILDHKIRLNSATNIIKVFKEDLNCKNHRNIKHFMVKLSKKDKMKREITETNV